MFHERVGKGSGRGGEAHSSWVHSHVSRESQSESSTASAVMLTRWCVGASVALPYFSCVKLIKPPITSYLPPLNINAAAHVIHQKT
jgi:hypothetical protein